MIEVLVKRFVCGILERVYSECNKACKSDEYLDTESCSCKKHLIDKLVLACEVEILNRTETSLIDEKVTCARKNCLIHAVSLKMI